MTTTPFWQQPKGQRNSRRPRIRLITTRLNQLMKEQKEATHRLKELNAAISQYEDELNFLINHP